MRDDLVKFQVKAHSSHNSITIQGEWQMTYIIFEASNPLKRGRPAGAARNIS